MSSNSACAVYPSYNTSPRYAALSGRAAASRHTDRWAAPVSFQETPNTSPVVFIVAHDVSIREACRALIRSGCWTPRAFASAAEFLAHERAPGPSCLIVDAGLSSDALALQQRASAEPTKMPVIFVAGSCDAQMIVKAMKAGAVDFLIAPFGEKAMLSAIDQALERSRAVHARATEIQELQDRYAALSPRERDVMTLVVSGLLNKQAAFELGIAEMTVKAHRGRVMRKMKAASFAELVAMSAKLDVAREHVTIVHRKS